MVTEEELFKFESEVNFYKLNLKDKTEQLGEMQKKMGFKECSEENIKQKQQESEELRANFEQTIKRLSDQKKEYEQEIEALRIAEFE